jgi:asparagine synthase (glutamine-hydrolysing)
MCGIAGITGDAGNRSQIEAMAAAQTHRGPDATGVYGNDRGTVALAHNRLSIIDLSSAGQQPMCDSSANYWLVFNGEIYNYLELRRELSDYPFKSRTDTEVLLAAYQRWGSKCLDRLVGMFAFAIWDETEQKLFAARDRFGVKPFYYHQRDNGSLLFASEIKALHAANVPADVDEVSWSAYLSDGVYDSSQRTFWRDVNSLPPGHCLTWQDGTLEISTWYDLADRCDGDLDNRDLDTVQQEYTTLLRECLALRFRSDVPVGINLSGGLDSSALLALVDDEFGRDNQVRVFTYICGDERYDELPWVRQMLDGSKHPLLVSRLSADEVPSLAERVAAQQDEPFGGLPTLAYSKIFARARSEGVIVLLDGQGMDEQWAGYDYYRRNVAADAKSLDATSKVQGTRTRSTRPECLTAEFRALAEPFDTPRPFVDPLRNLQYRDARFTKIPKALRFNDRVSMMHGTELREPFLDHRLFELAIQQPRERKIVGDVGKWMLRRITKQLLPRDVAETPKRPLQTPQREWLRSELKGWATDCIESAVQHYGGSWLDGEAIRQEWQCYLDNKSDNSFYIWQWISLGMSCQSLAR